jgi:hypothetical protein
MMQSLVDPTVTMIALVLIAYVCLTKPQRMGAFSLSLVIAVTFHLGMAVQRIIH